MTEKKSESEREREIQREREKWERGKERVREGTQ